MSRWGPPTHWSSSVPRDVQVKHQQAERRLHLTDLTTTAEEQQVYAGQAAIAQAQFEAAEQQQAQAQINLARTIVHSPVDGFVQQPADARR